jgi:mRNA-degrading endonuclease RelE of RelBE toxin-antitoxin system
MAYRVSFTKSAARELMKLPSRIRHRFDAGFDSFGGNPRIGRPGLFIVHELRGGRGLWTMVVGPFRGIYRITGGEVVFVASRPRPTAYRDLSSL